MITSHRTGRTIIANYRESLFFSGYAYLGMSELPEFRELVKEGIDRYGLSFPSSRISNTRLDLFEQFEQLLSQITGTEETVCFASGYLAATIASHPWRNNCIAAPGTHPAVYKGPAVKGSFADWSAGIADTINGSDDTLAIVADAAGIFTPALHDFSFLQHCRKAVTCIIDDSHSIAITGPNGSGVSSRIPAGMHKLVLPYSLSKGFNLVGGAVGCDSATAQWLRSTPEYTAATSLSPAYLFAFIKGQELYARQRTRLHNNTRLLRELLQQEPGIQHHPDLPVFVLPAETNEQLLEERGIVISSFAYPAASGKKMQRIVVNALHTAEDLEYLAAVLSAINC
ncbi:aminotransferase class I/II-fold pyridoxal phosphate-dependent enzyme [Deminuibacter soli]|uniref:Aminotransferase class I/II-fold pyridoxal phosphate-dependent enzyme n=1 Tax=Deminuibacter soli TaxID=2291815 RepID=A0A3E1NC24_9BACT|nr:aminotransferase class I/II-fold pyridoxal phosphate-dependent enzyme [Deminuibacter soli]RFM25569.1 aminotransferase class I/II-fold pyridoxal phosphate-dependent enzyme [Deminuibacter soli]